MGKRGSLPLRSHFRCALSPLLRGSPLKIPDFFLFFGNFLCDASSDFKEQLERDIAYAESTPDSNQKLDITVALNTAELKDADGLSLAQCEPHTYRIKDTYGNQERVTFTVRTITGTGTFLSDGEKTCTVGSCSSQPTRTTTSSRGLKPYAQPTQPTRSATQ